MTVESDVKVLEPGAIWEGYELDATAIGGGIVRFHGFPAPGSIFWKGDEFAIWPIQAEGFARTSDQQPQPKLAVGNVDGSISLLCLAYEDLLGAKLTRFRTFVKYLDAVNFPGGVNPTADPEQEFPPEVWFIERKSQESREFVEFELSSALDFQNIRLPRRQIIANQCPWVYRGPYCGYTGPAVADILDQPTSDPLLDNCGKRYQSCKLRIWPDGILNYGGFLAAGLIRT